MHTEFWWGDLKDRPYERSSRKQENMVNSDLKEMCWIRLIQDTALPTGCCKCGNERSGFMKWTFRIAGELLACQ